MNTPIAGLIGANTISEMGPSWLLDTNTVSETMRPFLAPRVAAFLDSIAGG